MSDYLKNLVARTFGLAPTVQPRLASLFEPVSAATNTVTEVPLKTYETDETGAALPSTPPIAVVPVTNAVPKNKAQTQPEASWHDEPDQKQIIAEAVRQNLDQRTHDVFRHTSLIPGPPRTSRNASATRLTPQSPGPITPHDAERPAVVAQIQTLPGNVSAARGHSSGDSWPELEPRVTQLIDHRLGSLPSEWAADRQQVNTEVTAEAPSPRSVAGAAAAGATWVTQPRQTVNNFPAPAEPPETISVTIGRVDVRAIFEPQAPTRSARSQTAAVNALDDYLKKRSEGRR
ncbi:MAG: hypothetical protein JWM21_672 [Acidobacteria bacterium]|nr:hypothetical protein [Acidobacteriota bacterium]